MPLVRLERVTERLLFGSRWLMAPFYLGLALSLALLMIKFVQELVHIAPLILAMKDTDVILAILTLIDLSLAGNLLLMVIFTGYENFVSRIDAIDDANRPAWMGKLDFGGLKLKLATSIVAISGIHLLKSFMNVHEVPASELYWQVVMHITFVVSAVLLALMDYLTAKAKG